jgi:SAM-dependent methyltransferase
MAIKESAKLDKDQVIIGAARMPTGDVPSLRPFVLNNDLYDLSEPPHMWNIDDIDVGEAATIVQGWSLPHGGNPLNRMLVVNGHPFELSPADPLLEYSRIYPWCPNAILSGFRVSIPHDILDVRGADEITFSCGPIRGDVGGRPQYLLSVLRRDLNFEIPDATISARIGVEQPLHYTMYGRSIFNGLDASLRTATGRSFADFTTIVDWGCGSGRVSRHVRLAGLSADQKLIGFDIDAEAVAWASAAIGPHFQVSGIDPPLDVAKGSVDLVYAYSVLTHLPERPAGSWVREMGRALSPGGIFAFTVLSETAMIALMPMMDRQDLLHWRKRGIHDSMENAQLESMGVAGSYYRNVWMTKAFIESLLQPEFELVSLVRSFHFYQDLVVARRRG